MRNDLVAGLRRSILEFPQSSSPMANCAVPNDAWPGLLHWASKERVVGQLWHASRQTIALTDDQQRELSDLHRSIAAVSLAVESSVPDVVRLLGAAGIEWRALKGVATSRLLYPDPSWRQYGDIDILVAPEHLDAALSALGPITAQAPPSQAGPARNQVVKERPIIDIRGMEIDVHFAVEGSLVTSRLPMRSLFADPQFFDVMGCRLQTMSNAALLVHAGLHLTSLGTRLSTVPDIVRLAALVSPTDPAIAELTARRTVRDLFVWSLLLTQESVPLPPEWLSYAAANRPSAVTMQWFAWMRDRQSRTRISNALLGPHRLRRMRESVWPSKSFLDELGISRAGNVARIARTITDAARAPD